jgi:hypothetical protein
MIIWIYYVFLRANIVPEVSIVSSLVPTSIRIPKSTTDGWDRLKLTTFIPLLNFVTLTYS